MFKTANTVADAPTTTTTTTTTNTTTTTSTRTVYLVRSTVPTR